MAKKVSVKEYERRRKVWTDALRSKKFKQTRLALEKVNNGKSSYCCLGVACKLFYKELGLDRHKTEISEVHYGGEGAHLPPAVAQHLGLRGKFNLKADSKLEPSPHAGTFLKPMELERDEGNGVVSTATAQSLVHLNDTFGMKFSEIADVIDKHPELLFKKGTYKVRKRKGKKKGA